MVKRASPGGTPRAKRGRPLGMQQDPQQPQQLQLPVTEQSQTTPGRIAAACLHLRSKGLATPSPGRARAAIGLLEFNSSSKGNLAACNLDLRFSHLEHFGDVVRRIISLFGERVNAIVDLEDLAATHAFHEEQLREAFEILTALNVALLDHVSGFHVWNGCSAAVAAIPSVLKVAPHSTSTSRLHLMRRLIESVYTRSPARELASAASSSAPRTAPRSNRAVDTAADNSPWTLQQMADRISASENDVRDNLRDVVDVLEQIGLVRRAGVAPAYPKGSSETPLKSESASYQWTLTGSAAAPNRVSDARTPLPPLYKTGGAHSRLITPAESTMKGPRPTPQSADHLRGAGSRRARNLSRAGSFNRRVLDDGEPDGIGQAKTPSSALRRTFSEIRLSEGRAGGANLHHAGEEQSGGGDLSMAAPGTSPRRRLRHRSSLDIDQRADSLAIMGSSVFGALSRAGSLAFPESDIAGKNSETIDPVSYLSHPLPSPSIESNEPLNAAIVSQKFLTAAEFDALDMKLPCPEKMYDYQLRCLGDFMTKYEKYYRESRGEAPQSSQPEKFEGIPAGKAEHLPTEEGGASQGSTASTSTAGAALAASEALTPPDMEPADSSSTTTANISSQSTACADEAELSGDLARNRSLSAIAPSDGIGKLSSTQQAASSRSELSSMLKLRRSQSIAPPNMVSNLSSVAEVLGDDENENSLGSFSLGGSSQAWRSNSISSQLLKSFSIGMHRTDTLESHEYLAMTNTGALSGGEMDLNLMGDNDMTNSSFSAGQPEDLQFSQ